MTKFQIQCQPAGGSVKNEFNKKIKNLRTSFAFHSKRNDRNGMASVDRVGTISIETEISPRFRIGYIIGAGNRIYPNKVLAKRCIP